MQRMKSTVFHWFVSPFGSLKVLIVLIAVCLLSRVADLSNTYWFLGQAGFDVTEEANPLMQMLFAHVGIWGGMLLNLTISPAFLLLVAAFNFHQFQRTKYRRFARILPVAIFMFASILEFLVALGNFRVFYSIYLVLSSFPIIQSIYNYSFAVIFFSHPIWIGFIVLFPLYKFGYGKEKALAT